MNPTNNNNAAIEPTTVRCSLSCERHPSEQFSSFCPSCLCERLTTLDDNSPSNNNTPSSSSRRPSSVSVAIKSLFSSSSKPSKSASFFPELRRSKSYSASKNEALGLVFEPHRKSCAAGGVNYDKPSSDLAFASSHQNLQSSIKIESSVANKPVFGETEEPEIVEDDGIVAFVDDDDDEEEEEEGEIKTAPDSHLVKNLVEVKNNEIVEEEGLNMSNLKPMKDHIDLDSQEKKSSVGGGLRAAASVLSKKWHKWKRKQKPKKQSNGEKFATLPMEKQISRKCRETQSEIADYGFGRRSCDVDPRFSLDACRISFDDPRYSLEEPRASWDGHMIGKSFPRMAPMVSLKEDAPTMHEPHNDAHIPVEESTLNSIDGDGVEPGGSAQTREYYSDSSARRRKSLDKSSSVRKTAAAVVDELRMVSDSKVSPTNIDNYGGEKILVGERDLRYSISNSLRDNHSETFELDNGFRDGSSSVLGYERKDSKKSRRWSWRIWDFIHGRYVGNKDDDEEEKYSRVNGVERSLSESWQDRRKEENGDLSGEFHRNMLRSKSSVSWRNANNIGQSFDEMSVNGDGNGNGNGKKKKDEFVLEKNRSERDSSTRVDNGLLAFYLTPLRSSSRRVGLGKLKPNNSLSIARSVLKLY